MINDLEYKNHIYQVLVSKLNIWHGFLAFSVSVEKPDVSPINASLENFLMNFKAFKK